MGRKLVSIILLISLGATVLFGEVERRRDQYLSDPGYFVAPVPYSLPGIGTGMIGVAMANNVYDGYTDFLATAITGDAEGFGGAVQDWYLVERTFKLDFMYETLSKAAIQSYGNRGMASRKEEYILVVLDSTEFLGFRATVSFFDKMLEFYNLNYLTSYKLDTLKDKEGNIIQDASDVKEQTYKIYSLGMMLDFTDDRLDPRLGIRFDGSLDYSPPNGGDGADYYVSNYNLTGYLPVGQRSTWVFNYFRSDANVITQGETDFATLSQESGLDCSQIADAAERQRCEDVINNAILANKNGTAGSLGGRSRLRAYTEGRFSGAHTRFIGTEFRWNLTEEMTPFDIWFMKDIRTGIQTAFFYEEGSVAERTGDLGQKTRHSYGAGFRAVMASGLVYRLDMADGEEGPEMTIIINYPWEIF